MQKYSNTRNLVKFLPGYENVSKLMLPYTLIFLALSPQWRDYGIFLFQNSRKINEMRWLIKSFYFAILCVSHQPFLVLLMCSSMFILYYKYDDVGSRQQSRLVAPSLPYNKQSGIFDQIYTTSKPVASILHSYRTFHIHTYGLFPRIL